MICLLIELHIVEIGSLVDFLGISWSSDKLFGKSSGLDSWISIEICSSLSVFSTSKLSDLKIKVIECGESNLGTKLYIPSTLDIDLILWHTQLIVFAENVKSWFKSWVFPFTFQAYILPHIINCMCVSPFKFHIWILELF